jgi:hypothetical protein
MVGRKVTIGWEKRKGQLVLGNLQWRFGFYLSFMNLLQKWKFRRKQSNWFSTVFIINWLPNSNYINPEPHPNCFFFLKQLSMQSKEYSFLKGISCFISYGDYFLNIFFYFLFWYQHIKIIKKIKNISIIFLK